MTSISGVVHPRHFPCLKVSGAQLQHQLLILYSLPSSDKYPQSSLWPSNPRSLHCFIWNVSKISGLNPEAFLMAFLYLFHQGVILCHLVVFFFFTFLHLLWFNFSHCGISTFHIRDKTWEASQHKPPKAVFDVVLILFRQTALFSDNQTISEAGRGHRRSLLHFTWGCSRFCPVRAPKPPRMETAQTLCNLFCYLPVLFSACLFSEKNPKLLLAGCTEMVTEQQWKNLRTKVIMHAISRNLSVEIRREFEKD